MLAPAQRTDLSNRFLHATFSPETGNLLELKTPDGRDLIDAIYCWHGLEGERVTELASAENARQFDVVSVHSDKTGVESILRSDAIEIRRRFELSAGSSTLRATYAIRGRGAVASMKFLAFPQVDLTDDFAEPFLDERDRYFDGAELGDGRELPAWRVFFRKGNDDGLILVARTKRDMSHTQIRPRGWERYPHMAIAYDSGLANHREPQMDLRRGKSYVSSFEIGPWSPSRHRAIAKAAGLDRPTRTKNPVPRGRAPKIGRGKVFFASKFAPAKTRSAKFDLKRWHLLKVPWAKGGKALFAGTGVAPPTVALEPKLTGTYRVFVGVGHGAGIKIQLPAQPEATYRFNHEYEGTAFRLRLSGKQKAFEVDCGVARFEKKSKLKLDRFPDRHMASMIDYVRLEPLSPSDIARWEQIQRTPPCIPLSGFNDTPDIAPITDAVDPSIEAYRANVWEHARCGFKKIYWRIEGQCCDYPSKVSTMRYTSARVHGIFCPQSKAYGRALKKTDMLKLAVDAAKKYGVELWGWTRFNYYYTNVQSEFFVNHPEYWEEWESGGRGGKLCLAIDEVRKHKRSILVEAAGYGLQGLQLGFLRHPPVFHYHPILVEGYTKKYGAPPPRQVMSVPGDVTASDVIKRFSLPESGGDWERWYQYRADFLTQFARELKQDLRDAGLGHVKISIWVRPNHALFDGIDIDAWINEGLCDEVVADAQTGDDAKLDITNPTPEWMKKVQAKVKLYRGIYFADFEWARNAVPRFIREGYDGICTYESDFAVLDSRMIQLYESLRQNT